MSGFCKFTQKFPEVLACLDFRLVAYRGRVQPGHGCVATSLPCPVYLSHSGHQDRFLCG